MQDICSGGEPCVPLRSKITHGVFYSNGKLTASYLDSLSGTTFAPLTDTPGKERSMSSVEDSPAKTFPRRETKLGSKENDQDSGESLPESLAKFDHGSSTWKTHQCLLFEASTESLETLPKWGMTAGGELWEHTMSAHLIKGTASGLWPTPRSRMTGAATPNRLKDKNRNLEKAVAQEMWPTPNSSDNRPRATQKSTLRRRLIGKQISLEAAVKYPAPNLATPQARDHRTGQLERYKNRPWKNLNDQVGGQLNPAWVEWLMGWPIGWTDLKPLATDKWRQWLHSHGQF